ncbi:hypothetical protein Hdeb2414_s0016g00494791 [Helianthus debilis subsp. tardiflorus]
MVVELSFQRFNGSNRVGFREWCRLETPPLPTQIWVYGSRGEGKMECWYWFVVLATIAINLHDLQICMHRRGGVGLLAEEGIWVATGWRFAGG